VSLSHTGASISPDPTMPQNYTSPVLYTVTAEDGSSQPYTVTVTGIAADQWARTVTAGADSSYFTSIAVDGSGNVYAAGYQQGTGTFTYGTGVNVTGTAISSNVVLVKYNA
ncbi:SBBP repeat-containing protein, partial [Treponema primitia]|uniref:SBBP repeat-containing protein n=1 Tax=Treponema primitia TaxID=88058 RepID=UPI0002555153